MSRFFNKLPGYARAPSGLEWRLFKKLPMIFMMGTLVLGAGAYFEYYHVDFITEAARNKTLFLFIALAITHWTFVILAAIGCIVVMIMKGPAYVADAYSLPQEDIPDKSKFP
ncbi:MAG TPA: hypothetical protein PLP44_06750 [Methylophilus sp.]|nr:hypothetical protein [Methylophilus sp.]